ncbi:MAG: glycosyltransferase family 2 protein [Moorea sp. SIO3C2]|nr:glycosyltransferase family 2 protein [Moorena sp. SIO3C2]
MQDMKPVAICIPTYNQSQYLWESVGSACGQTYANVEVWVSDDASTDETPEVMAQLCQQFPQVRYYRQPKNLGMAANNNWVLKQPNTEFIVRLDSDDALLPNYVETLLPLLENHPEAGYAHSAVQEIDERSHNRAVRRIARQHEFQSADESLLAAVFGVKVAANIAMFRAEALPAVRFYEDSPDFAQDYNMWVRMADAGYGNVYANEILACYRVWTDAKNLRPKRKNIELKGCIRVFEDSILPAFKRRGWDTKVIENQRRKLALRHTAYCYRPLFNEVERSELIALLKELGDSPALRFRMFLSKLGFRAVFEWTIYIELRLKGMVKGWLSTLQNYLRSQTAG